MWCFVFCHLSNSANSWLPLAGRNSVLGLCDVPERITRLNFTSLVILTCDIKLIPSIFTCLSNTRRIWLDGTLESKTKILRAGSVWKEFWTKMIEVNLKLLLVFPLNLYSYFSMLILKTLVLGESETLSIFLNFRLSKCFDWNAGRLPLFAAGGQYHRNNKTDRGKQMGVIMKLKKNGHKGNGITV